MHELINPKDIRFTEMKYINLSLTTLGKVIHTMTSNSSFLPPFRESLLTRLLKTSFLSNSHSMIIIGLNISVQTLDESVNTLRFAKLAKRVKTKIMRSSISHGGRKENDINESSKLFTAITDKEMMGNIINENLKLKKQILKLKFEASKKKLLEAEREIGENEECDEDVDPLMLHSDKEKTYDGII